MVKELKVKQSVSPGGSVVKNLPVNARRCRRCGFDPWVGKIPWRRPWQPILVFFSGESHGQKSLVDYSSQGCKELDMTEHACIYNTISHHHSHFSYSSTCLLINWKISPRSSDNTLMALPHLSSSSTPLAAVSTRYWSLSPPGTGEPTDACRGLPPLLLRVKVSNKPPTQSLCSSSPVNGQSSQ